MLRRATVCIRPRQTLSRLARVSHQQLMAGATQLAVTGAFARASLSTAAYQLRLTRKRSHIVDAPR